MSGPTRMQRVSKSKVLADLVLNSPQQPFHVHTCQTSPVHSPKLPHPLTLARTSRMCRVAPATHMRTTFPTSAGKGEKPGRLPPRPYEPRAREFSTGPFTNHTRGDGDKVTRVERARDAPCYVWSAFARGRRQIYGLPVERPLSGSYIISINYYFINNSQ